MKLNKETTDRAGSPIQHLAIIAACLLFVGMILAALASVEYGMVFFFGMPAITF